jgi:hypothetical protein
MITVPRPIVMAYLDRQKPSHWPKIDPILHHLKEELCEMVKAKKENNLFVLF